MNNDRNSRTQKPQPPRTGEGGGWRRIPLPPLPHFRRPADPAPEVLPAPAPAVDEDLAVLSMLGPGPLLPGPAHEGLPPPVLEAPRSERSGEVGATVLNDLVDQIERDIEKDLGRLIPETSLPPYRGAIPCTLKAAAPSGQQPRR